MSAIVAGTRISPDLTVLGIVASGDSGRHPVYIVWHARAWCPMACKVFTSPRRLRREAALLATLDHPNIVRCLGARRPAHLLMEFLEGPTLAALIRSRPRGRLGVSDAMRVAVHLGAALVHTHERGFVHLDVKPSNVIVVRGRPVLFDFGIACRPTARRLRRPVGTAPYMAPEQCRAGTVTPATDVFGFGVTLYESLTGRLPFPGGSRRPFPQITVPPRPLRQHAPAVPAALEELVMRAVDVARRVRSVRRRLTPPRSTGHLDRPGGGV
ncbi:MAG: serine/threonine protein kinase [Deltaproteobacteria bacterium]|nr:MAG: serine/threonine protein kinase [Deltaproteobacteria bacterium]